MSRARFCCDCKMALAFWEGGGHMRVGPKTMARLGICMRLCSFCSTTRSRWRRRAVRVARWAEGMVDSTSFSAFVFAWKEKVRNC